MQWVLSEPCVLETAHVTFLVEGRSLKQGSRKLSVPLAKVVYILAPMTGVFESIELCTTGLECVTFFFGPGIGRLE